jgi:pyruvate/2-oxoglutarate dehydrogenase complex dihydrolipoamide dehydrogenase (E3) component
MKVDALIIGAGQAASPLARFLADKGQKVALAEGDHVGGSCVNYGCSPTKTIISSAKVAHQARRGAEYGVMTGEIHIDFGRVMARAHNITMQMRTGNEKSLERRKVPILRAFASFEDANHVRVGDTLVEADRIYINTGTQGVVPDVPGLRDIPFLDEKRILELQAPPEHLLILGGGYIGTEYGQAMRRLGSKVTVIDSGNQILRREDHDVADCAREILEGEGLQFILESRLIRAEGTEGQVTLTLRNKQGIETTITGSHVMLAVGRRPSTGKLGLDKVGIETDDRGFIKVDDHLRTNVPHIYALGDVNGQGAFTHTSYDDYTIVADNIDGGDLTVSRRILTYSVFMDPPLGRVGQTEAQVRESGRKALMATMKMSAVGRAKEMAETQGFMKMLVDAETGRILGASLLGVSGDEAVNTIVGLMYADAHYTVLKNAVINHPTVGELLPTMMTQLKPLV